MAIEVKVPVLPESVSDATIATWHKKAGDPVTRDENLLDLETDKVVLEVPSPVDGILKDIFFKEGDTVKAQQLLARIESQDKQQESAALEGSTNTDNVDIERPKQSSSLPPSSAD